jgi:Protein of unknwon function (DUF3310)
MAFEDEVDDMGNRIRFNPEELGADNTQRMWETLAAKTIVVREERAKLAEKVSHAKDYELDISKDKNGNQIPANARMVGGSHYKDMDIEPWDVVDTWPKEQAIGSYRAGALKYIMRAGTKGEFKEDIQKAQHYLQKLLEIL